MLIYSYILSYALYFISYFVLIGGMKVEYDWNSVEIFPQKHYKMAAILLVFPLFEM